MNQQNQLNQIGQGSIIQAPIQNYANRQFKILQLIGKGQEGQVYKAIPIEWGENKQEVALKFQLIATQHLKTFLYQIRHYQNEYEVLDQSNYYPSNVIKIYDFFDYQFYFVTVMELGQINLSNYLKMNNLTLQYKQSICLQILSSIAFLHSQNTFHRDIKTENYIMVGQQVKLIDFGSIKTQNDGKLNTILVGSKPFQAPELIEGKSDYTMAVDVWAIALVFYEIIRGTQLFQVSTSLELDQKIKQHIQNQTFVQNKIDELMISDEWKLIMKRMLQPNPNERITSKEANEILIKSNMLVHFKIQQPSIISQTQLSQNQLLQTQPPKQTQLQSQSQFNTLQIQIQNMIQSLSQPISLNQLQTQKEQSIKLLSNLKDQLIMILNQLDSNPNQITLIEDSKSNLDSQGINKQNLKKELPADLKVDYEEMKNLIQEFEEKCISIQEEQELNKIKINLKHKIEKLKLLISQLDNKSKDLEKLQLEFESLKQKQKLNLQMQQLQEESEEIKKSLNNDVNKKTIIILQKENQSLQQQIIQLQKQTNTLNYYQEQKNKQEQLIVDLNKKIIEGENIEKVLNEQKSEIMNLKVEEQQLEMLSQEINKNEQTIIKLNGKIQNLKQNQQIYEQQQIEINQLQVNYQDYLQLEDKVKQNKETIFQMRSQLRQANMNKDNILKQQTEIKQLENEIKPLEDIQKRIGNLNEQIKFLKEQKSLKLEKEEEERNLLQQKEKMEKEVRQYLNSQGNNQFEKEQKTNEITKKQQNYLYIKNVSPYNK
ncbi:unnamed protein product [Paramecium sonneborni]|uniref:Protein kinase domain-containing protein n=1 Tax=Paramecium sonneborni TaxID=65129 RepID=A0A8S1PBR5_9CILI|nr:unnamed protein product [Paramecium sonneborni]